MAIIVGRSLLRTCRMLQQIQNAFKPTSAISREENIDSLIRLVWSFCGCTSSTNFLGCRCALCFEFKEAPRFAYSSLLSGCLCPGFPCISQTFFHLYMVLFTGTVLAHCYPTASKIIRLPLVVLYKHSVFCSSCLIAAPQFSYFRQSQGRKGAGQRKRHLAIGSCASALHSPDC